MLLQLTAALTMGATAPASDPAHVYHGRQNQLVVEVPRVDAETVVDGILDEPVWAGAAVLTGFSQYQPVDGLPAADSTDVLVWYGPDAIHFGIRAQEPHGTVNATLADRDRIFGGDYVMVLLDTFNDHRRALLFAANAFGVQADGIFTESGTSSSRGGNTQTDLSPDFLFESRGHLTDTGFEVEIRIPFESIRFQPEPVQSWGINIVRQVQHSGHQQTWTPARHGRASFLAQSGTLAGLRDLRQGLVLDVNPVITAKADGAYGPDGWRYDTGSPQFGANIRWGVTSNLALNGTVNPDFSQVESDAGQAVFDPRQALFFPEKRPFFLESSENFATPNRLIYTRRIVAPVAAAKFTGKLSGTTIGVLSAVDDRAYSATGRDNPVYNVVRISRDIGRNSTAGFVYTDRIEGDAYNRVAAVDTRLILKNSYLLSMQAGASFTRADWGTASGRPIFQLIAQRRGRTFNLSSSILGKDSLFLAQSGFVGRTGIVQANIRPSYTLYGKPGAFVQSWTGSITVDGTWKCGRFMNGRPADDQKLHFAGNWTLRGGWGLNTQFFLESFKYPEELYSNFYIDSGTDTVPYVGTDRIANYDLYLGFNTPQFEKFSAGGFVIVGRDENFQEWAPAWVAIASLDADWRPTDKLRVAASYVHQSYYRYEDHSLVALTHIPRVKLEYQVSRPIFIRLVGEYNANRQDDLRDDTRTNRPILLCAPGGTDCSPAAGFETGRFRADWLFSYQPSPGTVLFAGYGSTLGADDGFGFRNLRRVNDGFFLKLSYLFRL